MAAQWNVNRFKAYYERGNEERNQQIDHDWHRLEPEQLLENVANCIGNRGWVSFCEDYLHLDKLKVKWAMTAYSVVYPKTRRRLKRFAGLTPAARENAMRPSHEGLENFDRCQGKFDLYRAFPDVLVASAVSILES